MNGFLSRFKNIFMKFNAIYLNPISELMNADVKWTLSLYGNLYSVIIHYVQSEKKISLNLLLSEIAMYEFGENRYINIIAYNVFFFYNFIQRKKCC